MALTIHACELVAPPSPPPATTPADRLTAALRFLHDQPPQVALARALIRDVRDELKKDDE